MVLFFIIYTYSQNLHFCIQAAKLGISHTDRNLDNIITIIVSNINYENSADVALSLSRLVTKKAGPRQRNLCRDLAFFRHSVAISLSETR